MTTRTERFERKAATAAPNLMEGGNVEEEVVKFSPAEEAKLLAESNEIKLKANAVFAKASYEEAVTLYEDALKSCPNYLSYERAVIKSNIAACYLHTEAWKDAVKVSTEALELLDPSLKKSNKNGEAKDRNGVETIAGDDDDEFHDAPEEFEEEADEEIVSEGAHKAEKMTPPSSPSPDKRAEDVERIKSKALLRRARARTEMGGWSALTGAEEDYKQLSTMKNLSAADRKLVQRQIILLPEKTKKAQETEMAEMMGKLKQLGNGILKPFGLSTDHFQMVKDEKTGGYSMNFNQGGK